MRLTERETPRLGFRTTPNPHPKPTPNFATHRWTAAAQPSGAVLQPFAFLPLAAAFFLITLLVMHHLFARERHASRLLISETLHPVCVHPALREGAD